MQRFGVWVVGVLGALVGSAFADFEHWRFRGVPGFVRHIAVDPTNESIVYIAQSNAGTFIGEATSPMGSGVYRSTNGGQTWVQRSLGITDLRVTSLAIDPNNPNVIWAGTRYAGVFRTTDAGLNWIGMNNGLTNLNVYSVAVDPTNSSKIFVGTKDAGVFYSTTGGAVFLPSSGPSGPTVWRIAVDPSNPMIVYAATSSGVRKSLNGGVIFGSTGTMAVQEEGEPVRTVIDARDVLIDAANPSTLYAGLWQAAGVFKSTNAGSTWTHMGTGLLSEYGNWAFVDRLAQDPTNPNVLYASATRSTYRSIDAGATWVAFNSGLRRPEAFGLATTSTGGAFIGTVFADFHDLVTIPSGVDHFRCMKAKARGFTPQSVALTDRLGNATVTVLKPYRLCVPASVSGDPVADPTTALACYRIAGPALGQTLISFLENRLDGYRAYSVNKRETLCVSAALGVTPSAAPRDAYQCARGPRWTSEGLDLELTDAFGAQPVRITKVDRFCAPTDIDGAGTIEPGVQLRCDKILGDRPAPSPTLVSVTDQFGTLDWTLKKADSHCVQAMEHIF